jgi:predicted 3-demethylubiquinone-9 3-methyltransferase (glyoxalase superfamily)
MSKITPFLWFDNNLSEAIAFYSSVFKNSKLLYENMAMQAPDQRAAS